jgi:hypothetical protein
MGGRKEERRRRTHGREEGKKDRQTEERRTFVDLEGKWGHIVYMRRNEIPISIFDGGAQCHPCCSNHSSASVSKSQTCEVVSNTFIITKSAIANIHACLEHSEGIRRGSQVPTYRVTTTLPFPPCICSIHRPYFL